MTSLPTLLADDDLPLAERMAARLDGELYPLGDAFCAVDEPETPLLRLASVLAGRHRRLIAELGTAAWVWGASATPPALPELCVPLRARARAAGLRRGAVREVVLTPADVGTLSGLQVTTPLRTALDLTRVRARYTEVDADAVRRLAAMGRFALGDCLAALDTRRNLPDRRRAEARLHATL